MEPRLPHEQRSFPSLVDEPAAGPWWRRQVIPAVVIVVLALAAGAVTVLRPDTRVELRGAGQRVVRLATAAAVNRLVGQGKRLRVTLIPYPSPSGDKVAITAEPVTGGDMGIVILNRAGRVIGAVPTSAGTVGDPTWSPSGTSLAFPVYNQGNSDLGIWTVGGPLRTQPFPVRAGYRGCLWSPDGKRVICADSLSNNIHAVGKHWAVATVSGGAMAQVTGPGTPLAWLP